MIGVLERSRLLLLLMTLVVVLAALFQSELSQRDELGDDDLVFYYNSLALQHPVEFDQINKKVSARLAELPLNPNCHCQWEQFRFDLREKFRNNYALYHVSLGAVRAAIAPFAAGASLDYPAAVGTTIVANYYIGFFATVCLLLLILAAMVRAPLIEAAVFAILLMLIIDHLSPYRPGFWELRVRPSNAKELFDWFSALIMLFVSPSSSFVGYFPRALSTILVMGVFLVRWSGLRNVSYALLAVVVVIHQGNGALVLFTLLAIDAALRPAIFRKPTVLAGMAVALGAVVLPNGILGQSTGISWLLVPFAALAVGAVLLLDFFVEGATSKWISFGRQLRNSIATRSPITADMVLIVLLFGFWAAFSLVMYIRVGQPEGIYTWADLPARYLMLFRAPLFIGLSALLLAWPVSRWRRQVVTPIILLLAFIAVFTGITINGVVRVALSLRPLDREINEIAIGKPRLDYYSPAQKDHLEAITYFAISKQLETGVDSVTPLLNLSGKK